MSAKAAKKTCGVCDWEIKDEGRKVRVGGRDVLVCCEECADKAREQGAAKRAKARRGSASR